MKAYAIAVGVLFFIGTVDVVEDGIAHVEIRTGAKDIYETDMPVDLFPCEISEGDVFYAEVIDGVTEIRCGEPPE
jgi:hypothetical protein